MSSRSASLRWFTVAACALLALTVWLLPLSQGTRLFLLVVLVFSGVFVFVDSTGRGRVFATMTVALLALYLAFTARLGVMMMLSGEALFIPLGAALILLPALGAWAMVREVLFGIRVQRLGRILGEEGGLPPDDLPRSESGRIDRGAADAAFERQREETEAAPGDWRSWFRLSLAYDAAGDRKRARQAMRRSVALESGRAQA